MNIGLYYNYINIYFDFVYKRNIKCSNSQSYNIENTHENNATQVFPGEGLNFKNYKVAGNSFIT